MMPMPAKTEPTRLGLLDLTSTEVGDARLAHLATMQKLAQLDLTGTRVTGAGLGRLKSCPSLPYLFLGHGEYGGVGGSTSPNW
jgi:hypothetical protein